MRDRIRISILTNGFFGELFSCVVFLGYPVVPVSCEGYTKGIREVLSRVLERLVREARGLGILEKNHEGGGEIEGCTLVSKLGTDGLIYVEL